MKKPTLRVTRWLADIPVEAACSVCAGVQFRVKPISHRPSRLEYQQSLQHQFEAHVKATHKQADEDASN